MRATVTIEFKGYEFTGTTEFDDYDEAVSTAFDTDEELPTGFLRQNTKAIEAEVEEAALGVIEDRREKAADTGVDHYDDEEEYVGYEEDFDAMWNG